MQPKIVQLSSERDPVSESAIYIAPPSREEGEEQFMNVTPERVNEADSRGNSKRAPFPANRWMFLKVLLINVYVGEDVLNGRIEMSGDALSERKEKVQSEMETWIEPLSKRREEEESTEMEESVVRVREERVSTPECASMIG